MKHLKAYNESLKVDDYLIEDIRDILLDVMDMDNYYVQIMNGLAERYGDDKATIKISYIGDKESKLEESTIESIMRTFDYLESNRRGFLFLIINKNSKILSRREEVIKELKSITMNRDSYISIRIKR